MPKQAKTQKKSSLIGKQFRSGIGDCNALWEVKSSRGRGAYICMVVNEPWEYEGKTFDSDYAGQTRTFGLEEIEGSLRMDAFFAEGRRQHQDFYDSLALGQIVHYHDGFGQYIRCEVVTADMPRKHIDANVSAGEKCLKEMALVGNWRESDLRSDGYHMRGIRQARLFKPNASNIWESPKFERHGRTDPTGLSPLQISGQQEMFA